MANEEKEEDLIKEVIAEFHISMPCFACERCVAKVISNFKGVESFETDMEKHQAIVIGRIEPEKLLKKLKKKTGKRVEMVVKNMEEEDDDAEMQSCAAISQPFFDFGEEDELLMTFSDENPNSCSIF